MTSTKRQANLGSTRPMSRVDWAIARYNYSRAFGLLEDAPEQTGDITHYHRSPDPPPPKPRLKWYPLSQLDKDVPTTYQRSFQATLPAPGRRYCQRVEHARAKAMLARYQAEKEQPAKGTGQHHPFVEAEHDRVPAGQSDGGRFRAMNHGNGSSNASSRPKLRRTDTLETGTGHIWDVDGRPWELTRQQVKDWEAITSRGSLSEGLSYLLPSFWTSIEDFEAEVRRQARSYRDRILRVEGSAADANPIELANRRRDRAQAALQKDFAKAATTIDNATFVAGLATAPLKLGVKALTTTAERQAAAAIGAEARSLAVSEARSALTPPVGAAATLSEHAATRTTTQAEANALRAAFETGDSPLGNQLRLGSKNASKSNILDEAMHFDDMANNLLISENRHALSPSDLADSNEFLKWRSRYQGGPYPKGRFGRANTLWEQDTVYRSGQIKAERLIHEAGRAHGVDVNSLVDEILYIPSADAPFFAVKDGQRILALNRSAVFGKDASLRLMKSAHEIGHARVFANPAAFGHALSYEAEEVLVEGLARQMIGPENLSRRALRNSINYENSWRVLQGMPVLPLPK